MITSNLDLNFQRFDLTFSITMYEKILNEFLPIDLGELRKPGFIQMMLDQRDEQIKRVESKRGLESRRLAQSLALQRSPLFARLMIG